MRQATAAVHVERIRKLCRICASPAQSYAEKKAQYRLLECKDFVNELKETFCVDVSNDSAYRHPPFFCTKCRAKLNKERYFGKGRHVSWPSPCEHGDCDMCSKNIAKGGRPKKHVIAGRPKNASDKSVDLTTEIAISTVAKLVSGAASSEPLKQWEEKLLTPLVRRKVTTAPDKRTIQCPTGGQPLTLCKVTKGRKATKDVTARTVRRRTQELEVARDLTSGGDPHLQMAHEVRRVPRDELQVMLKAVKLDQVRIPDGHLLAAKTDLHLTVKLFPAASVTSLTDTVQDIIKRNADEG